MKNSWASSSLLSILIGTVFIGCGGGGSDSQGENNNAKSAFLSDSRIAGITYNCGSLTGLTDVNGKFSYSSSECSAVDFTIGGISLGSIKVADITENSVFYPFDILDLDKNNTTNPQLVQMLQLLQSLDSDNNPNNGISIDTNTTKNLESTTLDLDANTTTIEDVNSTLSKLGKNLIKANYAIAHYEETLRNDLNISVDTVAPAPAIVVSIPTETYTNTTPVIINGEKGAKVFVNGTDTNIKIDNNNSATLSLETIGDDINITSSITLKDDTNATSDAIDVTIFRPSIATLDQRDLEQMKTQFALSNTPRTFSYTPMYTTPNEANITFSESPRAATTADQTYSVTATITKGAASDTTTFNEVIPFSQALRDIAEVQNIKSALSSSNSPRTFMPTKMWNTGSDAVITFSEPKRVATAIDQTYNVTATITKGTQIDTYVFSEFVPTTNVNITLGDGTTTLINDKYKDVYTVTNGGIFQKVGNEDKFIGTAISIDTTTLSGTFSSSSDLLNYIVNNSGISLKSISSKESLDGSLVARYEINNQSTSLYAQLESLLSSLNYSITNINFSQYANIADVYVDFYIEYDSTNQSYVIVVLTDKTTDFDNDIAKIVNKDSIVEQTETIVNETETFTMPQVVTKGDFLFVIDDSGSMSNEQASAINAIQRTFATATTKYGLDWKATVIGTENDRNYSSYTQTSVENNISRLTDEMSMLGTSGGDERGLKIAYNYLSNGDIVERNDSSMSIIYLSDEIEHSLLNEFGETDTDFTDSYFAQNNIRFSAIIPTSFDSNSEQAAKMALSTGGERADLSNYTSGYDRMMDLAVRHAAAAASSIKLAHPALASSITVTVDGVREDNWEYDENENSTTIVFDAAHTPAVGSQVVVTYSHLDYAQIIADAKNDFDALDDNQKRAYTNSSVDVTFDPKTPLVPLVDQHQTYEVTVTFSKFGYSDTTTYSETVAPANFYTKSNNGWSDNDGVYVTQSTTSRSSSTLEVVSLVDSVMAIDLNDNSNDNLTIYKNGVQEYNFNSYNQDESLELNTSAGDVVKLEHYKYYASSVSDANATLQIYTAQELANLLATVKAKFDALTAHQRDYSDRFVSVTFDPAQPKTPLQNADQTYDVNVTFEYNGNTLTSTYSETVPKFDYATINSNSDWLQNGTTFVSQNHADSTTSTLNMTLAKDATINYSVSSESGYDYLIITVNGGNPINASGENTGTINLQANDTVEFSYSKDGGASSGSDSATITFQ